MPQNVLILATSLNVLHNYFDGTNKIIFRSVSSKIFRYFSKIVLSVYVMLVMLYKETKDILFVIKFKSELA